MTRFFILTVFLMPTFLSSSLAEEQQCLVDLTDNNRVSGRVEYVSYEHPGRDITISGYKLVLLKPRCFQHINLETEQPVRVNIDEIALQYNGFYPDLVKDNVGKTVVVTGHLESNLTAYYVAWPQIFPRTEAICEVAPKSSGVEKCD